MGNSRPETLEAFLKKLFCITATCSQVSYGKEWGIQIFIYIWLLLKATSGSYPSHSQQPGWVDQAGRMGLAQSPSLEMRNLNPDPGILRPGPQKLPFPGSTVNTCTSTRAGAGHREQNHRWGRPQISRDPPNAPLDSSLPLAMTPSLF